MLATLHFELPLAWQAGVPLAVALLALAAWLGRRRGLSWGSVSTLAGLRALAFFTLVVLMARPVWITSDGTPSPSQSVVLLVDRSESMSLAEGSRTRFEQALDFARRQLLPALQPEGVTVQAFAFAENAEPVDGPKLDAAVPNGKRTNLGGAIARALAEVSAPPRAIIALTDGAANERADNERALSALMAARTPLIGLGVGGDAGIRTLSLLRVEAPPVVAPNTTFNVSAHLEVLNTEDLPAFDLLLFRDGQLQEKKTIPAGRGARTWIENFHAKEPSPGVRQYAVQFLPPAMPGLKCVSDRGETAVRISTEKELRILYVQGALTWDYKFVHLALKDDPAIKLTGLTRTSKQSVFRQNVESAGELLKGFPQTMEEIAPFRVVVLSNLKPLDLIPAQQEILARFCAELGGGVLMIGGPTTFDASWQGSHLEKLLPVVFAGSQGVTGLDRPFRPRLTEAALQHPVFQVADGQATAEVWAAVPAFTQYGRVEAPKPGAQIWAVHPQDEGAQGPRILMAAQRYGAGHSAVICIQNFWRWRLARESDPRAVDRFWRQLFRFIGEANRQDVMIHLADQELAPNSDIRLVLERPPDPKNATEPKLTTRIRVESPQRRAVHDQSVELWPGHPVELSFHVGEAGLYHVQALDALGQPLATRMVEIREFNVEFQNAGRNMELLRQWAAISDGLALKIEECGDPAGLVKQVQSKMEQKRRQQVVRRPLGINGWVLTTVLLCLGVEWILRKRWKLP